MNKFSLESSELSFDPEVLISRGILPSLVPHIVDDAALPSAVIVYPDVPFSINSVGNHYACIYDGKW